MTLSPEDTTETWILRHRRPAAGTSAAMDIGDIAILGGKRFFIRGFDPAGVVPRIVYLEGTKTGTIVWLAFEELSRAARALALLHLVDDDPQAK